MASKSKSIEYIQVFGLHCSGTNILTRLLAKNCTIPIGEKYGAKHGAPEALKWDEIKRDASNTLYIHIYKNIYSWIVSMRNNPHKAFRKHLDIKDVISVPWKSPCVSGARNILYRRRNVFGDFLRIKKIVPHWVNIKYEDFLIDAKGIIETLLESYHIDYGSLDLRLLKRYKGIHGFWNRRSYYINREYMKYFTPELIEKIGILYDDTNEKLLLRD